MNQNETFTTSWIYKLNKTELQEKLTEYGLQFDDNLKVDDLRKLLSDYCKLKSRKQIMANNYNLHSFDGENWESFEQQLECIIALNEVPDSKKVPLLLTKISPKVFETLSCICAPEKPLKLTYIELCNKLRTKYTPLQSSTLDRASFRSRNQFQTETIEEYVLALRKLAGTCKFKDLDDQIKEKLIDGVYSKLIKFELLKGSPDATLDETVVLAKTVEAALAQTKSKNGTEVSDMFQYQQEQRTPSKNLSKRNKFNNSKSQGNKGVNKPQITCYCCGNNNHMKAECRLIHKYCSECGKQGHLYKVCPKNSRTNQIYTMETDDQGSDQSQIQDGVEDSIGGLFDEHIEVYSVNVRKIPPHYIRLHVEGKDLDFQLDTGSDVSVIPLKDKNLFFSKFNILDCNVRFRNFDQTISQPVGIMKDLTVNYENKSMKLNVFIAHDDVPRIIGRDWLDAFDLWPPKFMDTHIIGEEINYNLNVKSVSEAEHVIKEKFAEVFSSGWGDFKGEAIKLKLKSDAKPKCLPARRVPYAMKDKTRQVDARVAVLEGSYRAAPAPPGPPAPADALSSLDSDPAAEAEFVYLFQHFSTECRALFSSDCSGNSEDSMKMGAGLARAEAAVAALERALHARAGAPEPGPGGEGPGAGSIFDRVEALRARVEALLPLAPCAACRQLQEQLERLQSERARGESAAAQQAAALAAARRARAQLTAQHERERAQLRDRARRLERRLAALDSEYSAQLDSLRAAYQAHCPQSAAPDAHGDGLRARYQQEIEQLRGLCEKGLLAMESSHRRIVREMEEKHRAEREQLRLDKEQALAEETRATLAALDAMRKAHESEVRREVDKFKAEFLSRGASAPDLSQLSTRHQQEMEEIKREILSLSEKYSIKCVESAALEERLQGATTQLAHAQHRIMQLDCRNKQLRAHLISEANDMKSCEPSTLSQLIEENGPHGRAEAPLWQHLRQLAAAWQRDENVEGEVPLESPIGGPEAGARQHPVCQDGDNQKPAVVPRTELKQSRATLDVTRRCSLVGMVAERKKMFEL